MSRKKDAQQVRKVYAREGAPVEKVLVRYLASRLGVQ